MKPKSRRIRLDALLTERGLAESAQKALAMILAGEVQVDGRRIDKAGLSIAEDAHIEITSRLQKYASRGGIKLEGALEDFGVNPAGLICLDIGSSAGGFTDCLLQRGAARVYAVDVNVEQLDWKLQQNNRVIRIARNARKLRADDLPESPSLVVIDVSFISVNKVLAPACAVAQPGADFLILVKPQFELSREEIGPGGIVRDMALHEKAIRAVREEALPLGLEFLATHPSHLLGAEGNQEYFLHVRKKAMG
jgi:23S rRNA (cytidine1920-2'-O)/16S rRNA (cytidine1409-2'-O)-methyltransferase